MSDKTKKGKKMALGRGLDSLIPGLGGMDENGTEKDFFPCDIESISPNPYQPRRQFTPEELEDLSKSIAEQGIIQPLLVRKADIGYELIAGERRLRAAKMAGLAHVPVVVKDVSDAALLELSIVENIQRQNLNPMEEADAYHCLMTEFGLTQEAVAERVGKSRPAVANFLRLRELPDQIKDTVRDGTLSMGHARALLGAGSLAQMSEAWRIVIAKSLSVRETELLIKRMKTEKEAPEPSPPTAEDTYYSGLADNLSRLYGTKVEIRRRGAKGKVEIAYYSPEDLDRLLELLQKDAL